MFCSLCHHEAVQWVGSLKSPIGTKCMHCGGLNCQIETLERCGMCGDDLPDPDAGCASCQNELVIDATPYT